MSSFMLVFCSVVTAAQVIYIFQSFGSHYLKVALGYKAYIDLFFTLGLTAYFATTGALGSLLMSACTGLALSIILYVGRKVIGYRRYENGQWVEYKKTLDLKTTLLSWKNKLLSGFSSMKSNYAN